MAGDPATTRCDDGEAVTPSPMEKARALLDAGNVDDLIALIASLVATNSALQQQLAKLDRKGHKSSETVSSAQLRLLLTELEKAQDATDADASGSELQKADEELSAAADLEALKKDREQPQEKKKRTRPAARPFPEKLRRIDNVIPVPAADLPCPKCGNERVSIGHDVTEVLDRVPAELVVRRDMRQKVACKTAGCEGSICRAPLPDKLVDGGRIGTQMVACIVVDKYRDGLPLHRQAQRYRELGVDLPLSTLVDQIKHVDDAAAVLQQAALEEVLAAHVMHLDATGLPVMDEAHRKETRLGTLWAYVGDGNVSAYLYTTTGKKLHQREDENGKPLEQGPEEILAKRCGLVVADASNLFDLSFKREDLIECGCNAHGRRRFVKALDRGDSRAAMVIGAYRRLYELERDAHDMSTEERTALRQQKSRPVFDAILKWCQAYERFEPPSSPLGEAIRYFINHHVALGRFLDDGAIPIDNSLVERQHVRVALTRKNFLFVGSNAGGDRAAVMYTLLGCCALNQVDPVEYLVDVLPRLRGRMTIAEARELLPHRWKTTRASA
jgi:transposase